MKEIDFTIHADESIVISSQSNVLRIFKIIYKSDPYFKKWNERKNQGLLLENKRKCICRISLIHLEKIIRDSVAIFSALTLQKTYWGLKYRHKNFDKKYRNKMLAIKDID